MYWLDYVVFAVVMLGSLSVGVYFAIIGVKQKESAANYFTGKNKIYVIPTAFSLFSSSFSAILLVGLPAEIYTSGMKWAVMGIAIALGCFAAGLTFVPFLYKLQLISVFEYLERRFNSKVLRRTVVLISQLANLVWSGTATYAPCTIVESVTGFPVEASIILTILFAAFYTTTGGIRAVVWVDLIQSIIMLLGMLAIAVCSVYSVEGGVSAAWAIFQETGRDNLYDSEIRLTGPYTFWMIIISQSIGWYHWFSFGQMNLQRCTGLQSARKASIAILLVIPQILFLFGVMVVMSICIFAHYYQQGCDPLAAGIIKKSDHILPHFVNDYINLPGVTGLLLATIFSGALSSLSSIFNTVAAVVWEEIKDKIPSHVSNKYGGFIMKLLTLLTALVAAFLAFMTMNMDGSIITITTSVLGIFSATTFATFLCAALIPFSTAKGNIVANCIVLPIAAWILICQHVYHTQQHVQLNSTIENCTHNNTIMDMLQLNKTTIEMKESGLPTWLEELYSVHYLLIPLFGMALTMIISLTLSPCFGCGKGTCKESNLFIIPACGESKQERKLETYSAKETEVELAMSLVTA